jgi:hypothetical protein
VRRAERIIDAASQALNVFDFEAVARERLPAAHFGSLATGSDDDGALKANREGFTRFQLRVRRLVDIREIDMSFAAPPSRAWSKWARRGRV